MTSHPPIHRRIRTAFRPGGRAPSERSRSWGRGLLGLVVWSVAAALPLPAQAQPVAGPLPASYAPDARHAAAGSPYANDRGEVLIMVCRRGLQRQDMDPLLPLQELQQDLPLLCLATQTDAEALKMGPARFQQLLDNAAGAGALWLVVVPE